MYIISPLFTLNFNCCIVTWSIIVQPSQETLYDTRKRDVGSSKGCAVREGERPRGRQEQCPHWRGTVTSTWARQTSPRVVTQLGLLPMTDGQTCLWWHKVKPGSQLSTSGSRSRSARRQAYRLSLVISLYSSKYLLTPEALVSITKILFRCIWSLFYS